MNKDFIPQILQIIGYLAAFMMAISQYFLKDCFVVFFKANESIYFISTTIATILSILIIVAIFSNRYSLNIKKYFCKKSKEKYFASLRNKEPRDTKSYISEPRSYTIKGIAFVLIIFALIIISSFIYIDNIFFRSITYICFVTSVVGSFSIYATDLYSQNDWKQRDIEKKEVIMMKIKDYFAGDIQIPVSWRDNTNFAKPLQKMTIHRDSKIYLVTVDANDPDIFFNIQEVKKTS